MTGKRLPKDRTGQKFRCYSVVRTVLAEPGGKIHLLKCSECGAKVLSQWNATNEIFCPLPCKCGNRRITTLKVGDIRRNKEVLKIKRLGPNDYEIRVRCLNCGRTSTTDLPALNAKTDKPSKWCEHCKGESLQATYVGRNIHSWRVASEAGERITCVCRKCKNKITLPRKHFHTLKNRKCKVCLERRKHLDRDKVIYVLFTRGYTYKSIAEYFGLDVSTIQEMVHKMEHGFEGPDWVKRPRHKQRWQ